MPPGSELWHTSPEGELIRFDVTYDGETARVRALGEIDMAAIPGLSAEVVRAREAGCTHLVFDLREASFMDSSGLRVFLGCHADSLRDGYTIALIPGPPEVQRVFELTRTESHLPFIGL